MSSFIVLAAALTSVAFGQLNFKLYAVKSSYVNLAIAIVLFAAAQVGFFVALMDLRIGVVYMSTALTQGLVLLLSHYVLRETISRHHGIALLLIVIGIVLYAG